MRRFLAFLFIYAVVIFGLHLWLDGPAMIQNVEAAGTTYYISISGSNSNSGTSQGSPWKSAPGMQQAAGCGGTTHSYSPNPGDQFVFKGGDTWPAACFPVVPLGPGNSSVSDYWGACGGQSSAPSACAGATWPSTGWTRPIFDAQQTTISHYFTFDNEDYQIVDDIDMRNQNLTFTFGASSAIQATPGGSIAVVHILVENVYIHDFMTTGTLSNANGSPWYSAGGIRGYVVLKNSTIDDSGGFGFNASSTMVTGGMIGGGCENCQEVSGSHFIDTVAACFGVTLCHDTEITGQDQNVIYGSLPNFYNMNNMVGNHSQGVEAENGEPNFTVYNMWIHDNPDPGIQVFVGYCGSQVYNNVFSNNGNNYSIQMTTVTAARDSSSCRGYVYNNSIDCSLNNACVQAYYYNNGGSPSFILGQIIIENNQLINGSGSGTIGNTLTSGTVTQTTNTAMTSALAASQGYTSSGKYAPTNGSGATVGAGTNLSASCVGNLAALCTDTRGAPWFGGSAVARPTPPTPWNTGAYQFSGGSTGPPTSSVTAPANGATISGSSVTLTATCTTQGSATVASIQFYVDGAAFGSAGSSSPYSPSPTLDSTKISNGTNNHTIYAVCTDSNTQTNTSSTVTVSVNNSIPGCFVTNPSSATQQGFTSQTSTFTATWSETPNSTGTNDTVVGMTATNGATTFSQLSALLRSNTSGFWDAFDGATGTYHAANSASYVAGTTYAFSGTFTFTSGNLVSYNLSETSPSSILIASGWTPRAAATSLAYLVGISDAGLYDTAKVCNLQIGASPTLSYNPGNLSFGNVVATMTSMMTDAVSITNGPATITSAVVSGTGFTLDGSSTCPTSGSLSASCNYVVDFTPASAGSYSGTLTVTSNATGSPQVFNLTGTGVAATPSISCAPSSLNVGSVRLANPPITVFAGPITCTITNPPATFTSVATSGGNSADFGVSANACIETVSASTCSVTASFSPSLIGAESTTLVITATGVTGSPQNIALTATGQIPASPVAPSATMFMASVTKLFQVPLTINGLSLGTVPFNATINFTCTDCDPVKQTCGSCTAQ